MKDTVINRRKSINLFFTIIGLILLCFTLVLLTSDYLKEQHAIEVNAIIVEVSPKTIGYKAHVTYIVEEKSYDQYNVSLGINNKLTVGDYTKVKYDLNNPSKLIKNDHQILLASTGMLALVILVAFLPGRIKIIKTASNVKKLTREGLVIDANIQDIIIDNRAKKNHGYYPYRLRANYHNPTDNKDYLFESAVTYINPNDIITKYNAKTVKVYLDKTNTQNYFVDITSLKPPVEVVDPREYMKQFYKKAEPVKEEPQPEETKEEEEKK